jgi:L-seryl-tRNA(Ser) seleniumtransferase
MNDPRRRLPSVDTCLRSPAIAPLLDAHPRNVVVAAVREVIATARLGGTEEIADLAERVAAQIARRESPSQQPVINATGVVLHTNLGRAPIAARAAEAMMRAATGYTTLEYDLVEGERGSRLDHCRGLLAELTGADEGMVVVNGAGALVLALNALAAGREVILSRGELIEIGGSFRIPELLAKAGVVVREVGTTNRTHLDDYQRAITADTAAILTVHRSNFAQTGFIATPDPETLGALARQARVPYLVDVGSGLLHDLSPWGLSGEPGVQAMVRSGATVVIFSGDKLLGGPQAGCLVGERSAIAACRSNPFARAMRCDKVTLAGLEATLALHRDPAVARREIPVLAMLTTSRETLVSRAEQLAQLLRAAGATVELKEGSSVVGGGAFPGATLPTMLVVIDPMPLTADMLARRLRQGSPAVITRVEANRVLLDPRTIGDGDLTGIRDAFGDASS